MGLFKIGALVDWAPVYVGSGYTFELPESGFRAVQFDVMTDRPIGVLVVNTQGETWPVAYGAGLLEVRFSASDEIAVTFTGDKDATIALRTRVAPQLIGESGEASFVRAEPRKNSMSDDVRRVMYIMGLNAQRREAQLRAELERLRQPTAPVAADVVVSQDAD